MGFGHINVSRLPSSADHRGLLIASGRALQCALGRAATTVFKREGDGATPACVAMRPQEVWYRADRVARPQTILPVDQIAADDGWCDAPAHPAYNGHVRLPFGASHEAMMRDDPLYDICVVLDFNRSPGPRKRFGGSAIFLHCAKPGFPPTAGCIAVERHDLQWLVGHMDRQTRIVVRR